MIREELRKEFRKMFRELFFHLFREILFQEFPKKKLLVREMLFHLQGFLDSTVSFQGIVVLSFFFDIVDLPYCFLSTFSVNPLINHWLPYDKELSDVNSKDISSKDKNKLILQRFQ